MSSLECPTDVRQLLGAALHVSAILCHFRAPSCTASHSSPAARRGISRPINPSQRTCAVLHVQSSFSSARAPSCLLFQSMNENSNSLVIPPKFALRIRLDQSQHSNKPHSFHQLSISSLEVLESPGCQSRSSSATCPKHPRTTQQEFATNLCRVHLNSSS